MKLTNLLLRFSNHIKFVHVPGNILIGKHRIWPKFSNNYKRHLLKRVETEIENMKFISRPYLTQEEEAKIREANKNLEYEKFKAKVEKSRANKRKLEDRLISNHLDPLRNYNVWE